MSEDEGAPIPKKPYTMVQRGSIDRGTFLLIVLLSWLPILFFAGMVTYSCATSQPTPLKARKLTPDQRESLCQRIAKTDRDYAHCIGVKWESLEEDGAKQ